MEAEMITKSDEGSVPIEKEFLPYNLKEGSFLESFFF
jgi:hypothetical protein